MRIRKVSANQARRLWVYRVIRQHYLLEQLCEGCLPIKRFTGQVHVKKENGGNRNESD